MSTNEKYINIIGALSIVILFLVTVCRDMYKDLKKKDRLIELQKRLIDEKYEKTSNT